LFRKKHSEADLTGVNPVKYFVETCPPVFLPVRRYFWMISEANLTGELYLLPGLLAFQPLSFSMSHDVGYELSAMS
jgi:hypothetical protein